MTKLVWAACGLLPLFVVAGLLAPGCSSTPVERCGDDDCGGSTTSGSSGSSGSSGKSGSSGASGSSGKSGATSGKSGTSGAASGKSGATSGASGSTSGKSTDAGSTSGKSDGGSSDARADGSKSEGGVSNPNNIFAGAKMYVDPNTPAGKNGFKEIGDQPQALWLGAWSGNPGATAKSALGSGADQVHVFVAYNIPGRDCGGASSGGTESSDKYKGWIDQLAEGLGGGKAAIILEPDALALNCGSDWPALIKYGVEKLSAKPNTAVYIDAGHASWVASGEMATRLKSAGIDKASGFALNVSSFQTTADSISFGKELSAQVGNKGFIIDTGRNGKGPNGALWCNPPGRRLGKKPSAETGDPLVHAFYWIKRPGESDGNTGECSSSAPKAGDWYQSYAEELVKNAAY